MENYNKKDSKSKIRDMNNSKRRVNCAYQRTTVLAQKTSGCYNQIRDLVQKEIDKGKTVEEAIQEVLYNSASLEKLYPQLKEDMVKKKIISLIRLEKYKKSKMKKSKKIDDGEIEL